MAKLTLIELYDGARAVFGPNTYSRGNQAPPYALESLAGYVENKALQEGRGVDVKIIHERSFSKKDLGITYEEGKDEFLEIHDEDIVNMVNEQAKKCKPGEPIVVGIRAVSLLFNYALEVAKKIKESNPEIRVIIGGYHSSELKAEVYKSPKYNNWENELQEKIKRKDVQLVDCFVAGEGEETLNEFIKMIDDPEIKNVRDFQEKIKDIKGLVWRNIENQRAIFNGDRERLFTKKENKDFGHFSLPEAKRMLEIPARDEKGNFMEVPSKIGCTQFGTFPAAEDINEIQVAYSRGCFHNCKFCSSAGENFAGEFVGLWGKKITYRDPKEVIEEILASREKYGTNYVYFTDLTFNQNESMTQALLDEMKKHSDVFGGENKDKIHWFPLSAAFGFSNKSEDQEKINKRIQEVRGMIHEMKTLGCSKMGIGIEGLTPEDMLWSKNFIGTAKEINGVNKEEPEMKEEEAYERAAEVLLTLKLLSDEGIFTRGYFVLGMPGKKEVPNEIKKALLSLTIPEEAFDDFNKLKEMVSLVYNFIKIDEGEGYLNKEDGADEIMEKINKFLNDNLETFSFKNSEQKARFIGVDHLRIVPTGFYYGTQYAENIRLNYFDCYRNQKDGKLFLDKGGKPLPKLMLNESEVKKQVDLEFNEKTGNVIYRVEGKELSIQELESLKKEGLLENIILGGENGATLKELVASGFDDWEALEFFKSEGNDLYGGVMINFPESEKEIVNHVYSSEGYKNEAKRRIKKFPYLEKAWLSWEETLNKSKKKEEGKENIEKFSFATEAIQELEREHSNESGQEIKPGVIEVATSKIR